MFSTLSYRVKRPADNETMWVKNITCVAKVVSELDDSIREQEQVMRN